MRKVKSDPLNDHYLDGMKRLMTIVRKNSVTSIPDEDDDPVSNSSLATKHVCLVCGYMWDLNPDKREGPKKCPACNSILWNNKELHRHKCKQCSHRWMSKLSDPSMCPSCKSKTWNKETKKYSCKRCGYAWNCRSEKAPKRCPECGSENWTTDLIECICKRCGYSGKLKANSTGRCPICKTTLSICDPESQLTSPVVHKETTKHTRVSTGPEAYPIVESILRSKVDDTKKIVEIVDKAKLDFSDAEILVRFKNGEDPVEIARKMDVSLNRVIKVTEPIRSDEGIV